MKLQKPETKPPTDADDTGQNGASNGERQRTAAPRTLEELHDWRLSDEDAYDARAVDDAERQAAEAAATEAAEAETAEAGDAERKRKKSAFQWVAEHKDAAALEDALLRCGTALRYNLRASANEMQRDGGAWLEMNDRTTDLLRREIGERFGYATTRGESPLHYGTESWTFVVNSIVATREVDPVVAWFDSLPAWDNRPRLDGLLSHVFDVDTDKTDAALVSWASRYLCLGAVWRSYRPGTKQDEMPVLVGPQASGKSTLIEWLLPDEHRAAWYSDGLHLAAAPRDRVEVLQGRLIVCADEMAGSTRAELESLKAFLSTTADRVRLSYRRDPETLSRRSIVIGTSNGEPLPNDSTGNRRFVSVHLRAGNVPRLRAYLDDVRLQLWAEAVALYRAGVEAWLPVELAVRQAESNEHGRRSDELLEDRIDEWLPQRAGEPFTLETVARAAGFLEHDDTAAAKVNQRDAKRLAAVLRLRGFDKRRSRVADGRLAVLWRKVAA